MQESGYTIVIFITVIAVVVSVFRNQAVKHIHKCVTCEDLNEKPLFDIIHRLFPSMTDYYWLGDVLITLLVFFAAYVIYRKKLDVSVIILMVLMLFLIKCITTMVTILPDPSGYCVEKHGGKKTLKAIYGTCNDLMFSGHTGLAFLILFILQKNVSKTAFALLAMYVSILCFITVVTKNHYTIDVIVSFFVAFFVFNALK